MRLLIVSNTYPSGNAKDISGVASLAYEMACKLAADGHQVEVLNRSVDDGHGVAVGGSKATFPLWAGLRFWRLAGREPYDLIHVHESDGIFVVVLFQLARRLGLARGNGKLVATLQVSYDEERRQVRTVYADGEPVSEPTHEEKTFARFKARIHALSGWLTCRLADRVVAPSRVTRGELETDYKARDVAVIYNGISVGGLVERAHRSHEERVRREPDTETVIYAGRMRTRKGVAVLLHAFRKVAAARPRARLVLAGAGEQYEALRAYHREIVAADPSLQLDERIEFLGMVERDKIFERLAEADVYCLPSLYEGFPVATLEAMAVGLPIVTTTVSGNPEAIDDGVEGLWVEKERSEPLADALIRLLAEPETRRDMGRRARERVLRDFTIERIVADYRQLWQNLLPASGDSASTPTSDSQAEQP